MSETLSGSHIADSSCSVEVKRQRAKCCNTQPTMFERRCIHRGNGGNLTLKLQIKPGVATSAEVVEFLLIISGGKG